jgi:hypothetical protein
LIIAVAYLVIAVFAVVVQHIQQQLLTIYPLKQNTTKSTNISYIKYTKIQIPLLNILLNNNNNNAYTV